MKKIISLAIITIICQTVFCQYQIGIIPRISPDKGIHQKIGNTVIEIKYGSPSINSRQIWGKVVPYDKVWRAGANDATTIEFTTDVIIDNTTIKAGKYSFFIIPQKNNKWIAILNEDSEQWGAFKYNQEKDVLRIEVLPRRNNTFYEELNYQIQNYGFEFGEILLNWESLQLRIEINTSYIEQFKKVIESRKEKADKNIQWIVYLQGAEHLEIINSNLELANEWINKSELLLSNVSEWNKQFYPKEYIEGHLFWVKAKILAKLNKFDEAIISADKMKHLGKKSLFYVKNNKNNEIDDKIDKWRKN